MRCRGARTPGVEGGDLMEEYEGRVLYDAVLYGRGFYQIELPPVRISL
jgi:hypothetical protein